MNHLLLSAGLLVAVAGAGMGAMNAGHDDAPATIARPAMDGVARYVLAAPGNDRSCRLTKTIATGEPSLMTVDAACDTLLPGLSRAHYWQESDNGLVSFSQNGDDSIVSFAVSDGAAYETFAPHVPLLTLAETD